MVFIWKNSHFCNIPNSGRGSSCSINVQVLSHTAPSGHASCSPEHGIPVLFLVCPMRNAHTSKHDITAMKQFCLPCQPLHESTAHVKPSLPFTSLQTQQVLCWGARSSCHNICHLRPSSKVGCECFFLCFLEKRCLHGESHTQHLAADARTLSGAPAWDLQGK